jgi:hypothetical protein
VGGNPFPVFDGCFTASGKISFDNFNKSIGYSYNMKNDNRNERSLQGFSSKAKNIMKPCPKCDYWKDFEKFNTFYGKPDYANQWIMAALTGTRVAFSNGVVDFEAYDLEARSGMLCVETYLFVCTLSFIILFNFVASDSCCTKSYCHNEYLDVYKSSA